MTDCVFAVETQPGHTQQDSFPEKKEFCRKTGIKS